MERARFCLDVVIEAFEFVGEATDFLGIDDCLGHRISGEAGGKCGVKEQVERTASMDFLVCGR